jgi:hypothetical protein
VYREWRREVAGSQDAKHSLNQRRLKRVLQGQRRYAKQFGEPQVSGPRQQAGVTLIEPDELRCLLRLGIYEDGADGELVSSTASSPCNRRRRRQWEK